MPRVSTKQSGGDAINTLRQGAAARPAPGTRVRAAFTEMSGGRRAVAHVGPWTVAVADTVPGDLADVELRERRGGAYHGHLLALVRPSPQRVRPGCPQFEQCGGCQWQRLDPAAHAEYKGVLVRRVLGAVGLAALPVRVVPSATAWGYRTAGTYIPAGAAESASLGLHAAAGPSPVAIHRCPIQSPALQAAFEEMQRAWRDLILRLDDAGPDRSAWREIRIRAGEASREVAVGLIHAGRLSQRAREAVVDVIAGRITRLVEITVKPAAAARSGEPMSELRWGGAGVVEAMLDRWYHVPVFAPFPVTGRGAAAAVTSAIDALAADGGTTVLETEAGVGAYTLAAAAAARRVIARTTGEYLDAARRNARWNDVSNVHFADRRTETLTRMLRSYAPVGRALVQVTPAAVPFDILRRAGVERVVLVANSPARLAGILKDAAGFETRSVTVVDTHPQTSRAEIHTVLEARRGAWAGADYVAAPAPPAGSSSPGWDAAPTAASTELKTGQRDATSSAPRMAPSGDPGGTTR